MFRGVACASLFAVASCGSDGSGAALPAGPPNVPPIFIVTPTALTVGLAGGIPATFTALESNYSGAFTQNSTCAGVAVVTPPASPNGPTATFTVTPVALGTCTASVADLGGTTRTETITVIPGATPSQPVPSSSSLAFTTSASQPVTVSEPGYTGTLTQTNTCGGIATVSPATATGPTAVFTVTPVSGGACTVAVTDASGNATAIAVGVTTFSIPVR